MQLSKKIKLVFLILTLFVSSLQTSLAAIANCSELSNMNHKNMMQSMHRASALSIDQNSINSSRHAAHTDAMVYVNAQLEIQSLQFEQDQDDCCSTENTECASMHCPSAVVMALTVVNSSTITYFTSNVIINSNESFFNYSNFSIYRPPIA